jgi:hypothetical protein
VALLSRTDVPADNSFTALFASAPPHCIMECKKGGCFWMGVNNWFSLCAFNGYAVRGRSTLLGCVKEAVTVLHS